MGYVGNQTSTSYTSMDKQTITGSGATAYTLSHSVSSESEIEVFVNNIRQEGGSGKAYTVSGTTITFTEAITSSDECYIVFQGKAIQTVVPPDGSVGTAKILDDAVTSAKLDTNIAIAGDLTVDTSTLKVDSSANQVSVGHTAPTAVLDVRRGDADGKIAEFHTSTGYGIELGSSQNHAYIEAGSSQSLQLHTNGAERARIDSSGTLFVGRTTQITANGTGGFHTFEQGGNAQWVVAAHCNQSSNYGYVAYYATAHDGASNSFFMGVDTGAVRFRVNSDGDVANHDNSYGSTSDERIKQDIKDANSQWDDIKALKIRNYKKKDDVRQYKDKAWEQIGVVAQELEAAGMAKLITESSPDEHDIKSSAEFGTLNEDGTIKETKAKVKNVKYSVLYMKAIKALQEAMARIETLETKVKALEGK